MKLAIRVQIQDEDPDILLPTNPFEKDMNPLSSYG